MIARWIFSGILFALFLWTASANAVIFWQGAIKKQHTASWVPLFGGLLGMAAMLVAPGAQLTRWCWVPFILDYGSVPGLLHTAYFWLFVVKRHNGTHP